MSGINQSLGAIAIRPIPRIGRIVQVLVTTDALGVPTFTPAFINSPLNAIYIIDSPYGIKMQSSVIGTQTYYAQQGESCNQAQGNINFQGISTPDFRNISQVGFVSQVVVNVTFYFKIWLGTDSRLGFIDNRTLTHPCSAEGIFPAPSNTGIVIAAGATNQAVQLSNGSALSYGSYDVAALIGNLDGSNIIYNVNSTGLAYLMPIFPQQVYRVPINPNSQYPGGSIQTMYFANPGATPITITAARVIQNNGYGIEANP